MITLNSLILENKKLDELIFEKHKIHKRDYMKKYIQSYKGKETIKKYHQSEKGKQLRKKSQRKYHQSEKGKETIRKYQQSEKYKEFRRKYDQSEKGKIVCNRKFAKRCRNLKWIPIFSNPFDKSEIIEHHHIDNIYVLPLPKDLHRLYLGKYHRENTEYIVKQIYQFDTIAPNI